ALFARVKLVSLSTTLATNSIVEGRGARVGLIFMPHMPEAAAELHVEPKRRVRGQIGIVGQELEPLDPDEVRAVVDELAHRERVQAFAVSGFGGVMNPAHENQIKAIITETCGLPVVCGHELSAKLDFIKRANTAVLNARLVPIIGELMDSVKKALHEHGIDAALMVVKGDGTLMSEAVARQRPIETILSGPAASATGAHFLTDKPDAIAIDMGGTTTDTALLDHGRVAVTEEGATVGQWKTSVEAVEMLTTGLGGDSYLRLDHDLRIHVGPERVIPLAYLASEHPAVHHTLGRLAALASEDSAPSHILDFFTLTGRKVRVKLDERERQLLDALAAGPQARVDLSRNLGYMAPSLLRVERLEQLGLVRRSAVTPTDMLHVTGEFVEWSREAAQTGLQALASLMRVTVDEAAARIRREVVRRLAMEIIRKLVSKHVDLKWLETCRSCGLMLDNLFEGRGRKEFGVTFKVERPIVAIGAPVHPFMPEVARILNAELVIPDHADVANAVGAIVSQVLIRETMRIRQNDAGDYVLHSPHEKREFSRIESAQRYAEDQLVKLLRDRAAKYGTDELDVTIEVHEREGHLAKGEVVFLERVVEGSIAGKPVARMVNG
ncbi:MAG: hydantoinase/oxoprolinase family protein, partial [Planctomycetes bacterium]|nr:hydantoinase/oxoprolinase family protein [Planctomycetota bacterium]